MPSRLRLFLAAASWTKLKNIPISLVRSISTLLTFLNFKPTSHMLLNVLELVVVGDGDVVNVCVVFNDEDSKRCKQKDHKNLLIHEYVYNARNSKLCPLWVIP